MNPTNSHDTPFLADVPAQREEFTGYRSIGGLPEPDYSEPRWIFRSDLLDVPDGCVCGALLLVPACETCTWVYEIPPGYVMDVPADAVGHPGCCLPLDEWLDELAPIHDALLSALIAQDQRMHETREQREARWRREAPAEYELLQRQTRRLVRKMGSAQ